MGGTVRSLSVAISPYRVDQLAVEVGHERSAQGRVVVRVRRDERRGQRIGDEQQQTDLPVVTLEDPQGIFQPDYRPSAEGALGAVSQTVPQRAARVLGPRDVGSAEMQAQKTLERDVQG